MKLHFENAFVELKALLVASNCLTTTLITACTTTETQLLSTNSQDCASGLNFQLKLHVLSIKLQDALEAKKSEVRSLFKVLGT